MHVQIFIYAFFVLLGHDYNDDDVDDSVNNDCDDDDDVLQR